MTFHLCGSHSIFSLGYRRILVPERTDVLGTLKLPWGSGGVRQMMFKYWVCWVEAQLSQPGCSPAPTNRHLPGQMQLVPLEVGQSGWWWCAQFTAFLHMDAGTKWQGWALEHLEPDSCGHYPPWFQLLPGAHELLAGKVFIRLAFLKGFSKWLQVCCSYHSGPLQGSGEVVDGNEPLSHTQFSFFSYPSGVSYPAPLLFQPLHLHILCKDISHQLNVFAIEKKG